MLSLGTLVKPDTCKSNLSMAHLLIIFLLMPLAGCTGEGAGGPILSSFSTPTDTAAGLDSDQPTHLEATDSGGEEDPMITMTSTPTGVTAHVTWDHPPDIKVPGYYIYYGKRSPAESGSGDSGSEDPSSCSYGENQAVEAPPATITGLEPNTAYFFAIRAFNESESLCSNEIMAVTPPAQS